MSTFAVFGISHSACLELAKKQIPTSISYKTKSTFKEKPQEKTEILKMDFIASCANLLADHIYISEQAKFKQISAALDAPQFCRDFMQVAARMNAARNMKIMVKGDKFDKNGQPIIRKGVRVQTWVEWVPHSPSLTSRAPAGSSARG